MAMIVQHNLTAMNSNRMLGVTTSAQAKSSEKLSSGYRINRAADDAAGLTISEKMRKQIRGLDRASTNAQDGVSAVQTAEGALTEVHSMLQRMNELATQAANGTNSEADREAIQAEIDQLSTEIDRVAETTKFNEIYLLKGATGTKTISMEAHDAGLAGTLTDNGNGTATFVMKELSAGDKVSIGGISYNIIDDAKQTAAAADKDYAYTAAAGASAKFDISGWTASNQSAVQVGDMAAAIDGTAAADGDALVTALNADADFSKDYTASLDGDNLVITAKDMTKTAADVAGAIDTTNTKIANAAVAAGDITSTEPVKASFSRTEGTKLYTENGTKELSDEEALAELEKGNALYTTKGAEFNQTTAKVELKEATGASAKFDISGWTASNQSAVQVGDMAAAIDGAAAADGDALVAALNANADFSKDYTASLDEDNLVITAKDMTKTAADVAGAIDTTNTKIANTAVAAGDITSTEPVEASYETEAKALYATAGTEALTDEQILEALKNGDTLYSNAAVKGDNDITAKEAYALAKEELLKANQIGDTKGTAKVESVETKTAEDYKVGEKVTVDGTEYTIGDTAENAKSALDAAIDAANTAAATPANTANATAPTAVGSVSDGTTTVYIYKGGDGKAYYREENNVTGHAAAVPGGTDAAAAYEALFAEGKTVTFTPAAGDAVTAVVADDNTAGSTVVSAEKAAELENAGKAGGPNTFTITTGSTEVAKTLSFNLHVGADADMTNKIQVNIETMNSDYLGIKGLNVTDPSGIAGTYAIDAIQDAISKVSAQRSALGAVQNRLEHTITNLDNVVENTTSAESRIRDLDMAKKMVEYSKNNILAQAGQSMLAQANQSTQGVLSLLG